MSSSGCAQTSSNVPHRSMLSPPASRCDPRSWWGVCRNSTNDAPGARSGQRRRGLSWIEAGIGVRQDGPEPVPEGLRDLALGALRLDQGLEMNPERGLVRAVVAPGEVCFHPHPDHFVDLMVQEPLDLLEGLFALGPTLSHRPVPVLPPSATTHAPALSFPDADDSSRFRSGCP